MSEEFHIYLDLLHNISSIVYFSVVCLSMNVHMCVLLLSLAPLYSVTPPSLLWGDILHFTYPSLLSLIIFCSSTLIHSALL